MKNIQNYKSRFRILKGGRISLVVSALLVGGLCSTPLFATTTTISDNNTSTQTINTGDSINITSTGSITVLETLNDAYGVDAADMNGTSYIKNEGTITANSSGDNANGISSGNMYDNSSITNSGTMSVTAKYNAYGIYANSMSGNSNINNSETITVHSTDDSSYGIYTNYMSGNSSISSKDMNITSESGSYATGITTYNGGMDDNASVTSSGTMIVTATNGSAYGILADHMYGNASISSNNMNITAGSDNAFGIYVSNDIDGTSSITSSGTMSVTASDGYVYGIRVSNMYDNSDINNSGTINVHSTDYASSYGIYASSMYGNSSVSSKDMNITSENNDATGISIWNDMYDDASITNSGTMSVTALAGSAYGIYAPSSEYTNTITNNGSINVVSDNYSVGIRSDGDANVTNNGTITAKNSTGDLVDYGYSFTGTSIINSSMGTMNGNINATTVTNSGTINLANATAYIDTFNQTATGTLGIILDYDGTISNSQISATDATIEDGSTFFVDVTTAANNNSDSILDTNLTVITASNSLTVDATTQNVADNSILLDFEAWSTMTEFGLTAIDDESTSILISIINNGNSGVEGAATALDKLPSSTDPEISEFITYLRTLTTDEDIANAVVSATPTVLLSVQSAIGQFTTTMSSVVDARQSGMRGFNSGDEVFGNENLWLKIFGANTIQNDVDGVNGFGAHTAGFGIGIDGEYDAGKRAGFAAFYTKGKVDVNGVDQSTDLDIFNFLAYGSNNIIDDKSILYYQLGYGIQRSDSSRTIIGTSNIAKADYTSQTLFAQLKATREFDVSSDLKVIPGIFSSYTYFSSPLYTETGAGGMNLKLESFDTNTIIIGAESDFEYDLSNKIKLTANLGLSYDTDNSSESVSSSFQGAPSTTFSTNGIENSPWIYKAGMGVAFEIGEDLSLDIKYDANGRSSAFQTNAFSAYLNWSY
jgi:uncharacterized protein with beta-barrel porin domain